MSSKEEIDSLEKLGVEKLKTGELAEAVKLFRQALYLGSQNFNSRLLLTRSMLELERANRASEFDIEVEVRQHEEAQS